MKKFLLVATPFALALSACGDREGADTADMQPDAVEPGASGMTEETDPMDDAIMTDDTMTEDSMMDDPMMEEPMRDDPMMDDSSETL